jgi:hypothetical protein
MQGIFRGFFLLSQVSASVTFHCGIVGSRLRNLAKHAHDNLRTNSTQCYSERIPYLTTLQILDAVIVGRILLYYISLRMRLNFSVFFYMISLNSIGFVWIFIVPSSECL